LNTEETPVSDDLTLKDLMQRSFWVRIDKDKIHIVPHVYNMLHGGERYQAHCEEVGIPPEDTKLICRFLDDVDEKLDYEFTGK
jgi:hypothetical protein